MIGGAHGTLWNVFNDVPFMKSELMLYGTRNCDELLWPLLLVPLDHCVAVIIIVVCIIIVVFADLFRNIVDECGWNE